MWRRLRLALVLVAVVLGAGGCYGAEELNRLAIVGAVGFDTSPEGMRVVLQIIRPSTSPASSTSSGGGGSGGNSPSIFLVEASGRNPAEAISLAQTKISRRLYFPQAQLVVLTDRLLQAGVVPTADWLTRNRQLREDTSVVATHEDLVRFLSTTTPLAPTPSVAWKALLDRRFTLTQSIVQFADNFVSQDADSYLSLVGFEPLPGSSGGGGGGGGGGGAGGGGGGGAGSGGGAGGGTGKPPVENPMLMGVALFRRDRYMGDTDLRTARSLNWLLNRLSPYATVTAPLHYICPTADACPRSEPAPPLPEQNVNRLDPKEAVAPGADTVSVHVQQAQTKKSVRIGPDGRVHFLIKIDAIAALATNGPGFRAGKPEVLAKIDHGLDAYLEATLLQDIDRFRAMGSDPAGFGGLLMSGQPKYWRAHHLNWPALYQQAVFTIDVRFRTVRTGLTNVPIGYMDEEMRN
ncbi:MAG TPA: Ger(x)C family spore germination C-terminal domain-containing protein [Limnochordia bacterium]|nr:Ger(x)C family spore germination C-terminal domain-containing protein [Limnochordia bacterium]